MSRRATILAAAALLLLTTQGLAKEKKSHFLEADSIPVEQLLPQPPSVGSEEQKAEIDAMLAIQATRTDAQVKRFQAGTKLDMTAFCDVMGPRFTPENLPAIDKLLKAAAAESKNVSGGAKELFQRNRPYWDDDRLKPLAEKEKEYGYPSGHATRGILFARILAKIDPEHKDQLLERGRQIGWDRVIGGVHYPSDVAAGRELGAAIANALLANSKFEAELRLAKAEFDKFKQKREAAQPAAVAR